MGGVAECCPCLQCIRVVNVWERKVTLLARFCSFPVNLSSISLCFASSFCQSLGAKRKTHPHPHPKTHHKYITSLSPSLSLSPSRIIITTTALTKNMRGRNTPKVMSIFIALTFLACLLFTSVQGDYPCEEDEHMPLCEPCVSSCNELLNYPKQSCPKVCKKVTECFCKPGLLRTSTGLCVPHYECTQYEGWSI